MRFNFPLRPGAFVPRRSARSVLGSLFLFLILGWLFYRVALALVDPIAYPNRDFFTFWLSGRLILEGQNPYNSLAWVAGHHQFGASWIPNLTFIYPLPVAFLFAPLGALPLYPAYILWDILSQAMSLAAIALIIAGLNAKTKPLSRGHLFIMLTGLALFRPTWLTLVHGQFSAFLLFIISAVIYLWEREKWAAGAGMLSLLALKPNLGAPIIVLMALYLLSRRQIKALLGLTLSGLALALLGMMQNPGWLLDFWQAGNTKLTHAFGFSPTVWGISAHLCRYQINCSLILGSLCGLIFLSLYFYLMSRAGRSLPPALSLSLAVTLTLLLTPYTWTYDQLLLVAPLVTLMILMAQAHYRPWIIGLFFPLTDALMIALSLISAREFWTVGVPVFVFSLQAVFLWKRQPAS